MAPIAHGPIESLLTEISDVDQEQISGGLGSASGSPFFFYFDQIDIDTAANNDSSMSGTVAGGPLISGTSRGNSAYRLSRTTLAFGGFLGTMNSDGHSSWGVVMSPYQSIMGLLTGFLSIIGR